MYSVSSNTYLGVYFGILALGVDFGILGSGVWILEFWPLGCGFGILASGVCIRLVAIHT